MINQNRETKLSIIERKLNYLLDHPDLQRRYPEQYGIVYNRLLDRWVELHKPKRIHLNTS